MAAIQMNTRIDAELKSAGDSVFEAVGYTPTRVVRAVWGFAQRNQAKPEVVEELRRRSPVLALDVRGATEFFEPNAGT